VAFLIRKGTSVTVRKPSGEVIAHTCKDDCLFQNRERVGEYRTIQFKRGDLILSVSALDVTEVRFRCPQCGANGEIEGLCDTCRKQWLPKR
jgi:hypothetical protein